MSCARFRVCTCVFYFFASLATVYVFQSGIIHNNDGIHAKLLIFKIYSTKSYKICVTMNTDASYTFYFFSDAIYYSTAKFVNVLLSIKFSK